MTNPPPDTSLPPDQQSQPDPDRQPNPDQQHKPQPALEPQPEPDRQHEPQPDQTPERQPELQPEQTLEQTPEQTPEPAPIVQTLEQTQEQTPEPAPLVQTPAHLKITGILAKAAGYHKDLTPEQQITRRSFVSFTAFALLGAAAWKSWFWLKDAVHSDGVQGPLRKGLDIDDKLFKHTLSPNHLAKTYPREQAVKNVRYNSGVGLGADPTSWRLQVTKANGEIQPITLDELKALPKTDFAFEFKCIEGWSQISWWGGVRFSDFVQHYNLSPEIQKQYVSLVTPDEHYYVGVDTPSMMHPQTLLCYEMNGQPLTTRHGAPLRLIIPVKYGVKNLKCIGKLSFSNDRPRDYWFERGYDYYCGL